MNKMQKNLNRRVREEVALAISNRPLGSDKFKQTSMAQNRKKTRRKVRVGVDMSPSRKYMATLSDPFDNGPLPLGFGTMVETSTHSLFARGVTALTGTSHGAIIVMRPCLAGTAITVGVYSSAQYGLPFSDPAIGKQYVAWANTAQVTPVARVARVISAGLRVRVRSAATSPFGRIYSAYVGSDSYNAFLGSSLDSLIQLQAFSRVDQDSSGSARAASYYRPIDNTSYEFSAGVLSSPPADNMQPVHVIILAGFPGNSFSMDVDAILHIESLGGLATAAVDTKTAGITVEQAYEAAKRAGKNVGEFADSAVGFYDRVSRLYNTFAPTPFAASAQTTSLFRARSGSLVDEDEEKEYGTLQRRV